MYILIYPQLTVETHVHVAPHGDIMYIINIMFAFLTFRSNKITNKGDFNYGVCIHMLDERE